MKCKCIELSDISEYEDNDSCKAKYTIMQLQQENKQLKENWNKLKEYIKDRKVCTIYDDFCRQILDKMQELEKVDSNE